LEARARAAATRCCWPPDSSAGRWLRRSRSPTASLDVLGRGQGREQVEGLEHEADLVPAQQGELLLGQFAELDVADEDLAGGDPVQPGQAVHQGGLARAGGAHDGREAAARELDRDAVQRPDLGLALPVDLGHLDRSCGQRLGGVAGHDGS
jgi:hypothetical protein